MFEKGINKATNKNFSLGRLKTLIEVKRWIFPKLQIKIQQLQHYIVAIQGTGEFLWQSKLEGKKWKTKVYS